VNPNDQAQLEKALMFMHQSPEIAQKMGALARCRFETMFDITLMAKSYISIYQKVIFDKKLSGHGQGAAAKKRFVQGVK
jgi:glycosyltransferase involved in cell wall biosynthesis